MLSKLTQYHPTVITKWWKMGLQHFHLFYLPIKTECLTLRRFSTYLPYLWFDNSTLWTDHNDHTLPDEHDATTIAHWATPYLHHSVVPTISSYSQHCHEVVALHSCSRMEGVERLGLGETCWGLEPVYRDIASEANAAFCLEYLWQRHFKVNCWNVVSHITP
jgi:hypothetical protein